MSSESLPRHLHHLTNPRSTGDMGWFRVANLVADLLGASHAHVVPLDSAGSPTLRDAEEELLALCEQVVKSAAAVRGEPAHGFRFAFLGVPIHGARQTVCGVLCALDRPSRQWMEEEMRLLCRLAPVAAAELELLEERRERQRLEAALEGEEKTREALRRSEARFHRVVENLSEGLLITDLDDRVLYVNRRMLEITGFSAEELTGKIAYEVLLPEEERHKVQHEMQRRVGGAPGRYEVLHRLKDGSLRWLMVHGVPYRSEDGEIVGTLGLVGDVTERKHAELALRESEERYRRVVESVREVIFQTDPDGRWTFLNPAWTETLGFPVSESLGRSFLDYVHPQDRAQSGELFRSLVQGEKHICRHETRYLTRGGETRWLEIQARRLEDAQGNVTGTTGTLRDTTERRRAEEENQRLAALSRKNPNPVLECDAEGRPVHVNPAAIRVASELQLDGVAQLLPENHAALIRASLEHGEGFQDVEATVEGRIFQWTYRPNPSGQAVYLFAVDVTGRRNVERQLRHDALHDALTGLPNRLLFMERLSHAIQRTKRHPETQFAVLFLDLDRFKVINDSLGHHVGDELLVVVARRLLACLRTEDTVARLGGDEFAILLEEITGVSEVTRVAERIQAALATSVSLGGLDVFTSASIGIALNSNAYERPEYLLRNADMAMYRAKGAGHARFEVFDRAMHEQALKRLQLETDMRRGVERGEFHIHYQPIVVLQTGELRGLEALIRWNHPEHGWMSPDQFIPLAEETGIILSIGEWILRESCRQLRDWRDRIPAAKSISIGVNISAKQFSQSELVEKIGDTLKQFGLPARSLRVEITESAIMDNPDTASVLVRRLKALGVRISLDDFGTGYSSLSYLHRFPLDVLKVDRSFIGRMQEDQWSAQLVHTIVTLALNLGITAVAEGIETEAQRGSLLALGCTYGQGYLFSRPLTVEQAEELLVRSASLA